MSDDEGTGDNIYEQAEKLKAEHKERNKAKLTAIDGGRAGQPKKTAAKQPAKRTANTGTLREEIRNNEKLRGLVALDTFSARLLRLRPVPDMGDNDDNVRMWQPSDLDGLVGWFNLNGYPSAKRADVKAAVNAYAWECRFSSAQQCMDDMPEWDNIDRVATVFQDVFGTEPRGKTVDDKINYTRFLREVSETLFSGIINRVYDPGCQFDLVIILEGAQGIGKSTACRILALKDEWFSDTLPKRLEKDAFEHLKGKLIVEFGEFAIGKGRLEETKVFISGRKDQVRGAYREYETMFPRQNVFIATTNHFGGYLVDPTGNRRWIPIRCGASVDLDYLKKVLPQLYAEAIAKRSKWKPYLSQWATEYARGEQDARQEVDPWFDLVLTAVMVEMDRDEAAGEKEFWTRTTLYLNYVKAGDDGAKRRSAEMEIAKILRQLGGVRKIDRHGLRAPVSWYVFDIAAFRRKFPNEF